MATLAMRGATACPSGRTGQARRLSRSHILRAGSVLACIILWFVVTRLKLDLGFVTFRNVPSPMEVASGAWKFVHLPTAPRHLIASLRRVGEAFGLATFLGVGIGLLAGHYRTVRDIFMPPLEIVRPIPAVAWIPLAILVLPSSEASMVFITFLGALFPILLNTVHGVECADRRLIASARSLGAGPAAIFREVIVPSALPNIVTGLVLGIGTAWFCLVSAEMISGQFGVGYFTWMSYTIQDYPDTIVGMILIGLLGLASSLLVRAAGRALMPWHGTNGAAS